MTTARALIITVGTLALVQSDAHPDFYTSCSADAAANTLHHTHAGDPYSWTKCEEATVPNPPGSALSVHTDLLGPHQYNCTFFIQGTQFASIPLADWGNLQTFSKCNGAIGPNLIAPGARPVVSCQSYSGSPATNANSSTIIYGQFIGDCK